MLVLILATGYFSSNAFSGDLFFMRKGRLSSSLGPLLSCFDNFGDKIGEFFMESLRDVLLPFVDDDDVF